jgi:hypothetical protein
MSVNVRASTRLTKPRIATSRCRSLTLGRQFSMSANAWLQQLRPSCPSLGDNPQTSGDRLHIAVISARKINQSNESLGRQARSRANYWGSPSRRIKSA